MWTLALAGVRAHRAALSGTALTLAAAGAVVSVVGVLAETGLRGGPGVDGGMLTTLASSYAGTALVVVVLVTAATVSLALRGRRRELALLRMVGATRHQVRRQVALEVMLVALIAVPLGAAPGVLLAGRLAPLLRDAGLVEGRAQLALSPFPVLGALALLLPTALLAGRMAARETLRVPATTAVRESAVEASRVGPVRRLLAVITAGAGLVAAFTPLAVPGTVGAASAAVSAFLLVGAAALAGPELVARAFGRVTRVPGASGPAGLLALHNVRGFSRRLTTVVVPLAVALSTGTVQTSVDAAIGEAATQQLRAAVTADLVVTGRAAGLDRPESLPGVSRVAALGGARIEVRTDGDDLPDSLVWEAEGLRVLPADTPLSLFDPGIVHGSMAALAGPGTVAVSTDAAFELGIGIGDPVEVREDGAEHRLRVVAVYERGLGVGDYLAAPATARALGAVTRTDAVLVDASGPVAATATALRALGLGVSTPEAFVASSTSSDAAEQRLSTVLLLLLLVFVGLGAANALVLTTAGRRDELVLLSRTGTTRRQLLRMILVESLLTGGLAWAVGTVAVVPAVLGVSVGLLGWQAPVVSLPTYAVLSGVVLAVATTSAVAAAAWVTRPGGVAGRARGQRRS